MPKRLTETVFYVSPDGLVPNRWGSVINPPHSPEDLEALRSSIQECGIQTPLIAWRNGRDVVVAGLTRLSIARELKLEWVPVLFREFEDAQAAKRFAITDNAARRHLTMAQKAELALQYKKLLSVGRGKRTDCEPCSELNKVDSWQEAAMAVGISKGTVSAMKAVLDSGDNDLIQSVRKGDISINRGRRLANLAASTEQKVARNKGKRCELATVLLGDCSKLLSELDDQSVHLLLTDPPYALPNKRTRRWEDGYGTHSAQMPDWDKMSEGEYLNMMRDWMPELKRVLKPDGSWYIFAPWWSLGDIARIAKDARLRPRAAVIWKKRNALPGAGKVFVPWTEYVLYGTAGNRKTWNAEGNMPDWIEENNVMHGEALGVQPAQKPVALLKRFVELSSNKGDMVLDPFAGTGSTGVAAVALGRRVILMEQQKRLIPIINARLAETC